MLIKQQQSAECSIMSSCCRHYGFVFLGSFSVGLYFPMSYFLLDFLEQFGFFNSKRGDVSSCHCLILQLIKFNIFYSIKSCGTFSGQLNVKAGAFRLFPSEVQEQKSSFDVTLLTDWLCTDTTGRVCLLLHIIVHFHHVAEKLVSIPRSIFWSKLINEVFTPAEHDEFQSV